MTAELIEEEILVSDRIDISIKEVFDIQANFSTPGFKTTSEHVPNIDKNYHFDEKATLSILAGFKHNRRVMLQGMHGTGKSTHIEQVAARLNWPCIRVNLDGNISRLDLIGKDTVTLKEGKQVTEFQEGILPWAMQRPVALIFDEYDAGRPEVMFVIQRMLEREGKLTLLDKNQVITPHPDFRIFATANTIGQGDLSGLYRGVQVLNHAQIDRWNIVASVDYLSPEAEITMIIDQVPQLDENAHPLVSSMVQLANLTRNGFKTGEISSLMSPRTIINWAENYVIFDDLALSLTLSFINKCEIEEQAIIAEYFQRCFNCDLT